MNKENFAELTKMTKDFYETVGDEFSDTRQNAWKGWNTVLSTLEPLLRDKNIIKILDLGAGNGRFLKFLQLSTLNYAYLGVDGSEKLLHRAIREHNIEFKKFDFIKDITVVSNLGVYTVVTAFGITHHIPGEKFRKNWFAELAKLVEPDGFLVCTFWNFDKKKGKKPKNSGLEKGDYILGWGLSNAKRYCHFYSDTEKKQIIELYKHLGLTLIRSFKNDGKNDKSNDYLIFRKLS